MKNIFTAICVIALSLTSVSCREQDEMFTNEEAQSLKILKQATDESDTYVAPAVDSDGEPPIPPPKR